MALALNTRFGPYDVGARIGAGGMGEVYRARDSRLQRDVALKVLPADVANDADRLARFRREAQLLAALNHPNIAHVYGLEESDLATALVMELVDGEDLAKRISRGPIPCGETLAIAKQIASALEAAHGAGIVHRDLKPANIKLSDDGTVKVLDFGLAKAIDTADGSRHAADGRQTGREITESPTITTPAMTQAGMILGTAAYMSPEQAKGRPVDKRADVWAFGCVLYEMLTGVRAFVGDDVTDTLAAILRGEPDWSRWPPDAPEPVQQLVRGCLQKDLRARVPDIGVARYLLEANLPLTPHSSPTTRSSAQIRTTALIGAAALAVGVLLTLGISWLQPAPDVAVAPVGRFATALDVPAYVPFDGGTLAIASDASFFVYVGGSASNDTYLVSRQLDQLTGTRLEGTSNARFPFVSLDNKWIGFFAGGELKKVPVSGGTAIVLSRYAGNPRGGTWTDDGTIVFATTLSQGLMRVSESGGEASAITKAWNQPNKPLHIFPTFVPGAKSVIFSIVPPSGSGDTPPTSIASVHLETGAESVLVPNARSFHAQVANGFLVSDIGSQIQATTFDTKTLKVSGNPVAIASDVSQAAQGFGNFAVSNSGVLLYVPSNAESELSSGHRSLVWVDRRGVETPIGAPMRSYEVARVSPDGTRIAVDAHDEEHDIWIWDTTRNTMSRLTLGTADDMAPIWTRDAQHLFFTSNRSGVPNIYRQRADGAGSAERLTESGLTQFLTSISADSSQLVMFRVAVGGGEDIALASLRDLQPPVTSEDVLIKGDGRHRFGGEISPDGRWMALHSNETGRHEVYVRPFPNIDNGRWQISTLGGTRPAWSRDGRELFYLDDKGRLTSVPISVEGTRLSPGRPVQVLNTAYVAGSTVRGLDLRSYDLSPDGRRFLMVKDSAGRAKTWSSSPIITVTNWPATLRARPLR